MRNFKKADDIKTSLAGDKLPLGICAPQQISDMNIHCTMHMNFNKL